MKICAAQIKPFKADIPANISRHKKMIELAVSNDADMIIFPELSITGYEPGLAKELATVKDDQRLDEFQIISDNKKITICIGMPIQSDSGIFIGLIIFRSHTPRGLYCKQYLHTDELPFFIPGTEQVYVGEQNEIALSICYELSVPEHSAMASHNGAKIYLSSAAKTAEGVAKAVLTLAGISKQYAMISIMCNCTGHCDNFDAGGKTSAWNNRGELIGQLDDVNEGILLVDTNTGQNIIKML